MTRVNVPVRFQSSETDVTISPGDYLIADVNGVVVLPKALAKDALPLMEKQVAADAQVAAAIKGGMTFVEASRTYRV